MSETLTDIWNVAWPIIAPSLMAAVVALWSWFSNEVRSSEWYARQPLRHRKLIDFFGVVIGRWIIPRFVIKKDIQVAVQPAVERLMPKVEAMKDKGAFTEEDAEAIRDSAANAALNTIVMDYPHTDAAVDGRKLVEMIDTAMPAAIKKAKQKRRTGGTSPGARR